MNHMTDQTTDQPTNKQAVQDNAKRLVLASQSGVRRDLLAGAGLKFEACVSGVDEAAIKQSGDRDGPALALALSVAKAQAVSADRTGSYIIGADQVLACDGQLFDKPADMQAARQNLTFLRGKTHSLLSGVALVRDGEILWQHCAEARLTMRDFSDDFLDIYLAQSGAEILSSVGCYRLEALGSQLFEHIEGDYFTILGLPLVALLGALRHHGVVLS